MNAAALVAHYARIAEAPDAIARLRRFVLNLAVRGRLVPQDSSDESASDLLKRIAKEKARLVKAGSLRDRPPVLAPSGDNEPFSLPSAWCWVRLAYIVDFSAGRTPARNDPSLWNTGDHSWVSIGDMEDGQVLYKTKETVSNKAQTSVFGCQLEPVGTIIMSFKLTIGKIARLGVPAFHNEAIISIRPHLADLDCYLFMVLPQFARAGDTKGAIKGATLNRDSISNIAVPLPPLAEQHRIVAKVDELMSLCDRLEAAQTARETTRDRLAAASLARLNTPDPETFPADARFALDALPALTTRPDQIKQLRQTILSLAVRGKLVPQDAEDEPAAGLLARLRHKRKVKRKALNYDEAGALLPELPKTWLWTSVDEIAADCDNAITDGPFGSQLKTEHYVTTPGFRVVRLQNIGQGTFVAEHRSYVDQSRYERLAKHHVMAGDLVVAGLVDPRVRCCQLPADIGPALVKADCYRFSVDQRLVARFALFYLNSLLCQEFAAAHHHGMTLTRIRLGNFRTLPFPLPPLAEQHRIVAKVNALMTLCDQLEGSLITASTTRVRLLEATLRVALLPIEETLLDAAQ